MPNRLRFRRIAIGLSVLLGGVAASAQTRPADARNAPPQASKTPVRPESVESLVAALADPSYERRREAETRLLAMDATALPALEAAYNATDDYEVRMSVAKIAQRAFVRRERRGQSGFLGIQLQTVRAGDVGNARIPNGQIAIRVDRVVPGHAAERAGLRDGDVILSLDGEPTEGESFVDPRNTGFRKKIRSTVPGTSRRLEVLRGDAKFNMDVVIGERPLDRPINANDPAEIEEIAEVKRNFAAYWSEHFALDNDPPTRPAQGPRRVQLDPLYPPAPPARPSP